MFETKEMEKQNNTRISSVEKHTLQDRSPKTRQPGNLPGTYHFLQRNLGNSFMQSIVQSPRSSEGGKTYSTFSKTGHEFSHTGSSSCCSGKRGARAMIQTKLAIGPANDVYEQEADRVAEQVMRMPDSGVKSKPDFLDTGIKIRRVTNHGSGGRNIGSDIQFNQSGGRPLSDSTRRFMESRFGVSFGHVRLHEDKEAHQAASQIQAKAFTYRNRIWLRSGESESDKNLMAHELAHVVQQVGIQARPELTGTNILREQTGSIILRQRHEPRVNVNRHFEQERPWAQLSVIQSSRVMRAITYDSDCDPEIDEVRGNVSRAQGSAERWARAGAALLQDPQDAASLLTRHFNIQASNEPAVRQIRETLIAIAGHLAGDAFTYHCRPDSDARCHEADGTEYAGFAYPGQFHIYFCNPYPYQNFFGHHSLIDTTLHEAAHAHDASFNHDTYESNNGYPPANALTNADSYSSFSRDAALGRRGLGLEVSLGGLMSAEPQFYIGVGLSGEVGGPALDIFNLRIAERLGFMPGTELQPTRGFLALDIGARINPISRRIYVDLTTGAFMGMNFTDVELMAGVANRVTAGYRGDRIDLGLDLTHFWDLVGREHLVIVGVRGAVRF